MERLASGMAKTTATSSSKTGSNSTSRSMVMKNLRELKYKCSIFLSKVPLSPVEKDMIHIAYFIITQPHVVIRKKQTNKPRKWRLHHGMSFISERKVEEMLKTREKYGSRLSRSISDWVHRSVFSLSTSLTTLAVTRKKFEQSWYINTPEHPVKCQR